jgi:hypothetical protein
VHVAKIEMVKTKNILVRKLFGRTRHRREDTVKISLTASGNDSVNWIRLDQERCGDRLL